jgi:hypothetical protein
MRIDPEDFRRHYAMLSDEALFALNRGELIEMAQACYDAEVARRKAALEQPDGESEDAPLAMPLTMEEEDEFDIDEPSPHWLDDAACACTFTVNPGAANPPDLAKVRGVLRAAGIPCHITMNEIEEEPKAPSRIRHEYCLMVPGGLNLNATSVLDRDLFNAEHEADWRSHLEALSDEELRELNPKVFCAGLLDRAARLKRAYEDEVARRRS